MAQLTDVSRHVQIVQASRVVWALEGTASAKHSPATLRAMANVILVRAGGPRRAASVCGACSGTCNLGRGTRTGRTAISGSSGRWCWTPARSQEESRRPGLQKRGSGGHAFDTLQAQPRCGAPMPPPTQGSAASADHRRGTPAPSLARTLASARPHEHRLESARRQEEGRAHYHGAPGRLGTLWPAAIGTGRQTDRTTGARRNVQRRRPPRRARAPGSSRRGSSIPFCASPTLAFPRGMRAKLLLALAQLNSSENGSAPCRDLHSTPSGSPKTLARESGGLHGPGTLGVFVRTSCCSTSFVARLDPFCFLKQAHEKRSFDYSWKGTL